MTITHSFRRAGGVMPCMPRGCTGSRTGLARLCGARLVERTHAGKQSRTGRADWSSGGPIREDGRTGLKLRHPFPVFGPAAPIWDGHGSSYLKAPQAPPCVQAWCILCGLGPLARFARERTVSYREDGDVLQIHAAARAVANQSHPSDSAPRRTLGPRAFAASHGRALGHPARLG